MKILMAALASISWDQNLRITNEFLLPTEKQMEFIGPHTLM
jgi:hypothetical protein